MASSILSIGQSALAAAQVGLSTTSHNIANAGTPGYSRQVVVQGAAMAQNFGFGFLGQGTDVASVKRIYNEFLGSQMRSAQSTQSALESHYAQIRQIDNMLGDPVAGLSPGLQNFFSGLQEVSSNPALIPARQSALSSAESLVARFHSLSGQLKDMEQGVNSQVISSVNLINTYAQQISQLNDAIARAVGVTGQQPNDLLDQRDQLVLDLNKEIKTTVVKQGDGGYNVFIGNGQPLVVGGAISQLAVTTSLTNTERLEVAYRNNSGTLTPLKETSLAGGTLGGLIDFRSQSLEPAQNALGRVAIGLASNINAQHQLGFDLNGNPGGALFTLATPAVNPSSNNTGNANIAATLSNANALTTSDYRLTYDGTNYTLTRLSDATTTSFAGFPQTVDGVTLNLASGAASAGDSFLIRPTANGASGIALAITDPAEIAAAAVAGAVGDNSNALLLAGLQSTNILANGTTTFQGAYSQLVSQVGNKTRELEVTSVAAGRLLSETNAVMQSESGVNLDEEATNLLRYQQAYQAAGKAMQIAGELFDVLLSLGR